MDRRKFISSAGVAGVAALYSLPAAGNLSTAGIKETANSTILKAGPYLQSPLPGKITIRWITHEPCFSWVEYGELAGQLTQKATATEFGLVEAYNTVHAITLTDLLPGKQYFYRVCSKKIESFEPYKLVYGEAFAGETSSFDTLHPASDAVSFLVFNDIHDRPESFPHLLQYKGEEKRDFVFLNGDMFNYQTDEDQLVNHLLQPLSGLCAATPFIFSRGNHETRGKFARRLPDYFNSSEQGFYFSFQYGPMYAIVLDSGEDKADDTPVYAGIVDFDRYRLQQAEWLKKEVSKKAFKKAKYKVVFSHIPLFYSGDWHGPMHCRASWNAILNDAGIDLLVSGHTHTYGIHPAVKGQHNYPIVIGGGPQDGKRTIIKVKADSNALVLDMLDDSGRQVGSLRI